MKISDDQFFRQSALRIFRYLDLEEAAYSLLEHLKDYMPLDFISFYSYKEELGALQVVLHIPEDAFLPPGQIFMLPTDWIEKVRRGEFKGVTNDPRPEENTMYRKMFMPALGKNISGMRMMLTIEGRDIGMVNFMARGRDLYTREHARLCELICEPLSMAYYNTVKYQETLRLKNILADYSRDLEVELKQAFGKEIVGENSGLKETMEKVRHVAGLDSPVLLLGETGVGKEVIANAIHNASPRKDKPLIKINCGAIPDSLIDSALFGHEKGAFTGADDRKYGRFERADRGTIFLDEVAELPLHAQTRMLRIIQFGEFERVGGSETIHTDIRIIAATHKNLADLVASNAFRSDLFFRINVFPIEIPALRQRKEDIPALVAHFIDKKSREIRPGRLLKIAPGAMEGLLNYHWPGNVRELENIIEREIIMCNDNQLKFNQIFDRGKAENPDIRFDNKNGFISLDLVDELHIRKALKASKGKIHGPGGAAELLNINPNTLRSKIRKLKIPQRYGRVKPGNLD